MADQAQLYIPVDRVPEGANFTATVNFKDAASATASAPATVHYRIDCLTTNTKVLDWTSVTPGDSVSIVIAGSYSAIVTSTNAEERKQLTVAGDKATASECIDQKIWIVRNDNLVP
jgi:hypothetical protein